MAFFVYFLVLLVAAGSVLFGLDSLQAPMPATPQNRQPPSVASTPTAPATPAKIDKIDTKELDAKLSPVYPANPRVPNSAEADAAKAQAATARPTRKCDVSACARAYYSFSPSDCTYQPAKGPRRLCTKGVPPKQAPAQEAAEALEARAQSACNVAACQRAYTSFNAADCTYQPFNGPRRICEK